jgi:hypothetical protein
MVGRCRQGTQGAGADLRAHRLSSIEYTFQVLAERRVHSTKAGAVLLRPGRGRAGGGRAARPRSRRRRHPLAAVPPPAINIDPANIRAGWKAIPSDEPRTIVAMFIESESFAPARPQGDLAALPGTAETTRDVGSEPSARSLA